MDENESQERLRAELARRDFLKRMAAFAFVVPIVSSFTLDATAAYGDPGQSVGNQCMGNQIYGNQYCPNQTAPSPSTTTVVSSVNPSALGQSVTFTATVTSGAGGIGTPTGSVTFADNGTPIGTGKLNSSGVAILVTASLAVGCHQITATYSGDASFGVSTSGILTQLVFAFAPGGGSFVIGDVESTIGLSVDFWGAQWSSDNPTSSGSQVPSFKGFAANPSVPTCGAPWSTGPGNSAPPPGGPLPAYMGVIVTDNYSKSGSLISGDIVHIVVVKTDPGYEPDPGHPGTGTVVAQVC